MGCIAVYDGVVKRWNQALVAGFAVLLLAGYASAQIHAAPPSVTSIGFGGHPFSGVFTSVTSLGPQGYTPGFNPAFPNSRPFGLSTGFVNGGFPNGGFRPHHRPHGPFGGGYGSVYAVPYFVYYDNSGGYEENYPPEEQYNGGPTIFDRRGPGTAARPPEEEAPRREVVAVAAAEPEPPSQQPDTVLVFKDGHQLQIGNYAIVGDTLYDLTDGHRRKIALTDLDLTATVRQNDDRGIDFQLPAGAQVN